MATITETGQEQGLPSISCEGGQGDKFEVFKILWLDSFGATGGWQNVEDYNPTELTVISVGIKLFENEKVIALAPNYAKATTYTSEQANGIMVIPKCSITNITSCSFCPEPV